MAKDALVGCTGSGSGIHSCLDGGAPFVEASLMNGLPFTENELWIACRLDSIEIIIGSPPLITVIY